MAEFTYKCPKCSATLKPARAVPPGKKIKCPKCENIFAPASAGAPAKTSPTAPKAAAAKPKFADEDDEGGVYGLKDEPPPPDVEAKGEKEEEEEDEDAPRKKKKDDGKDEVDLLGRKFPKSRKSAAQAACQGATNQLLATGTFACFSCLISIMVCVWPLVFRKERLWSIELLGIEGPRLGLMVFAIVSFAYNGVIALGAVKMQSIESAVWANIACLLAIIPLSWVLAIPAFTWVYKVIDAMFGDNIFVPMGILLVSLWYLFVGIRNLKMLRDPDVVAAFAEPKRNDGI